MRKDPSKKKVADEYMSLLNDLNNDTMGDDEGLIKLPNKKEPANSSSILDTTDSKMNGGRESKHNMFNPRQEKETDLFDEEGLNDLDFLEDEVNDKPSTKP